jgi:hypothetical protein
LAREHGDNQSGQRQGDEQLGLADGQAHEHRRGDGQRRPDADQDIAAGHEADSFG